jgi:N-methylhydantoinase B
VRGGGAGASARQFRLKRDGSTEPLDACAQVRLADGERIQSYSCGGGGYGPPTDRDPARVARDVAEGWISAVRARDVYGVVLDGDGAVMVAETAAARNA